MAEEFGAGGGRVILERVTNISMGTEINAVNEFEDLALVGNDAPTAISLLD
jgi:tartronate-semialdehyde synthase